MKYKMIAMILGILLISLSGGCAGCRNNETGIKSEQSDAHKTEIIDELFKAEETISENSGEKTDGSGKNGNENTDAGSDKASATDYKYSDSAVSSDEKADGGFSDSKDAGDIANTGPAGNKYTGSSGASDVSQDSGKCPDSCTDALETVHSHTWVEITETVQHEATGHYEKRVVKEAWEEPVYEALIVCGCGKTFPSSDKWSEHVMWDECAYSYSVDRIMTGTIHHDEEYEEVWIEDSGSWAETKVTGYRCSACGAVK